ncbi:MAG: S1C family serine protease [Acidimicrobiales bacterium]
MTTIVDELHAMIERVATAAGPSVVRIGRGPGRGAGVVIGDGTVLTNAHNLQGDEATVTFDDGRAVVGTVRGIDGDGDLAVLAVDTGSAPAIGWGSGAATVGTPVFALANPAGRGLRVTFGLVSAVGQMFRGPGGRRIGGSIEHTAPLSRGSSGGPVVDGDGTLLGINTHRVGDGFYLAIPATADLKTRIDALSRGESLRRVRLGVALAPAHAARRLRAAVGLAERDGLLIRGVESDSPAARAGLRLGDLLVAAGGQPLASHDDLFTALESVGPPGTLTLTVVRGTDEVEVTVTFDDAGSVS